METVADARPVVLVTDAADFVGSHVIRQLIDAETYMVRGGVADLKAKPLVKAVRRLVDPEPEPEEPEPETKTETAAAAKQEDKTEEKTGEETAEKKEGEEEGESKDKDEKIEDNKESEKKEGEAADKKETEEKEEDKGEEKKDDTPEKKTEEEPAAAEPEEEEEEVDESKLQVVEIDGAKPESWEQALNGVKFVVHIAGPVLHPGAAAITDDDIKTAVDNVNVFLKACQTAKVSRVVITSALVAITGVPTSPADGEKTFTEEDWADVEKADMYTKAKVQVEKAAWDFVKELTEEEKFELVVINPAPTFGPVAMGKKSVLGMDLVKKLLERGMQAIPKVYMAVSDVRDVASAHINALTCEAAAGQRHIVMTQGMWMREIAQILAKEFKPRGYSVPTMLCPYVVLWMKGLFDKAQKAALPTVGKTFKVDNAKMKDVLGVEAHSIKDTLCDMGHSLITNGLVKKTKKYKGPQPEAEEEPAKEEETKEANGTAASAEEGAAATAEDKTEGEASETKDAGDAKGTGEATEEKPGEPKTEEVKPAEEAPKAETEEKPAPASEETPEQKTTESTDAPAASE